MELKYLSTSQVFINTGMRERSIAYSRLVDGNSRQDLDIEDRRKLKCVAPKIQPAASES